MLTKSEINGYYHKDDPGEPGGNGNRRLSVSDTEAQILATFCEGKNVLEIGTGLGVATLAIAAVCDHIITVDIDPFIHETIFPELVFTADNIAPLKELPEISGPVFFDVCLIDGLHTHEQVMKDIREANKRVRKGGLLLFHDYNMGAVRLAIFDSGLEHFSIPSTAGLAVAWNP